MQQFSTSKLSTSKLSTPTQESPGCLAQRIAIAVSIAISVGIINWSFNTVTRFQFQQQVGNQILSGVFEGSDTDTDGVLELSELQSFQANWGDYAWSKEDLEAFVWGEKQISQGQERTHGISGLNLFARNQKLPELQVLEIWNREVTTSTGQQEHQGVQAIEYGQNISDTTLFSAPDLNLQITSIKSQTAFPSPAFLALLSLSGLLALSPFQLLQPSKSKPCCSQECSG
ncbi:MAG: hypothetical protein ACRC8A_03760 [Microcoleaceae cyanobacterium]